MEEYINADELITFCINLKNKMSVKNDNFKSDGKVAFPKERNLSLT